MIVKIRSHLFFSRKEPKGEALRGFKVQLIDDLSPKKMIVKIRGHLFFSRKEPKGEALRGFKIQQIDDLSPKKSY
jgi:hypothetical protein